MNVEPRNVSKRYRSIRALDHVSLMIEPGQIISLLGLNGAGKTTLLRCLAGIAAPDEGKIYFDNETFYPGATRLASQDAFHAGFSNSFRAPLGFAQHRHRHAPFWGRYPRQ